MECDTQLEKKHEEKQEKVNSEPEQKNMKSEPEQKSEPERKHLVPVHPTVPTVEQDQSEVCITVCKFIFLAFDFAQYEAYIFYTLYLLGDHVWYNTEKGA